MSSEEFFKEGFIAFLNDHFRGNPTAIAHAFGVRERTAENWLAGINIPAGVKVGHAILDDDLRPSLMRHLRLAA